VRISEPLRGRLAPNGEVAHLPGVIAEAEARRFGFQARKALWRRVAGVVLEFAQARVANLREGGWGSLPGDAWPFQRGSEEVRLDNPVRYARTGTRKATAAFQMPRSGKRDEPRRG
jgi:hypothetical protein